MTLLERLRVIVEAVPAGGAVTLPRDWLVGELAAENGAPGCSTRDDLAAGRIKTPTPPSTDGGLLTAREVAKRLGCSVRYVYAHAARWPFTVRLDGRAVRFDAEGLARWTRRVG